MKKSNYLFVQLLVSLAIVTAMNSCNSLKPKPKGQEVVVLEPIEIDSSRFDDYDAQFEEQDTALSLLGRGSTWRTWRKLHKECMKAEWFKNAFYFGVSNTVNIGAIVDIDFGLQRTMDSSNGFSDSELNTIINYGEFATCGFTQELTMSLNVFFQSEFDLTNTGDPDLNAQLHAAIARNQSTKVKVDYWRINNIKEDNLMDVLNDAPDSDIKKKRFLETLKKENHFILVREIEIKGFTSEIELETEMSAELEAKLSEGVVASMGNAGMEAEFKFKDKRTIEVKSGGNFYVFGQFKQAKKVTD